MTEMIQEPGRATPVVEDVDVVVCGGGPAGVAAAIAAARGGARTRLVETHGCLGGTWTAGMLTWLLDHENKGGLMREIVQKLDRRGAGRVNGYDVEQMKKLLEELCLGAGVGVRLHTRLVGAHVDADRRLSAVLTESKSGREAWRARAFIDCTGDGDLAAQAGCGFEVGRPDSGECQPMSLICLLAGVKAEDLIAAGFVRAQWGAGNTKKATLAEMRRAGVDPSYGGPTLLALRDDLIVMMANHQYGVSATNAQQITDATIQARAEVHALVDGLRSLGGVWRDIYLVATAAQIGVREGRRIHGRYTVTTQDIERGARFDDAVCRVTFNVDVHATDPKRGNNLSTEGIEVKPYDIPLRALIAADVDGLLMAGRCISGDFFAHASYRVTGNAVPMGEAAGKAAACAALTGRLPHEVAWEEAGA